MTDLSTTCPTTPHDHHAAVTTRRATPADAADVAVMVAEIAAHEDQAAHVHVQEEQWRRLLARPEVIVLLAEHSGGPVGYVSAVRQLHLWTGGDVVNLDDLYVRPGHRDAGVGRQLMATLAGLAKPEQLLIRWSMEVDNADAQRFYRRLGAGLRHKVLAAWPPTAYAEAAAAVPPGGV
ncbi:GNAT family N-acetyltransferase [Blastococcus sp. VKM Ac-2987]|uniref:GNAT family N-acetyltransferase n=1 Tax=Blastococcus sp. VKM Ac-2987 TaxID=3004141 RepID=UPI0022ABB826|nr:GNAT family N-acetyltransferase [Blastococcus sp. VKM Ac-2987]MCZ2860821.1 GNAT family N-acetyltransferase [Blastococcus sp. VKM Ac-2987]